jgi:hypothetical protein
VPIHLDPEDTSATDAPAAVARGNAAVGYRPVSAG